MILWPRITSWFVMFLALMGAGGHSYAATTTRIEYQLPPSNGKSAESVVTDIHEFDESPLSVPASELVHKIQESGVDHVLVVADGETASDTPLSQLAQTIEAQTQAPTVQLSKKDPFFKRVSAAWKESFQDPARKPDPEDFQYGIVSTVGEAAPFTVMVLTAQGVDLGNALALAAAQSALAYYTNVYNNGFNHFLESSFQNPGQTVKERTFFWRKLGYEYITSQVFKWIQDPRLFLTTGVQSNILMNTLMVGAGDVVVSNSLYKAYKHDKVKLAKMNFYTSILSNIFGSLDLIQHALMPVLFQVSAYEFRVSGLILMGYYAGLKTWIKKNPDGLYRHVDRVDRALRGTVSWVKSQIADCRRIFSPKSRGPGEPLQSGL